MERDQYIYYPALSASRIKSFYNGEMIFSSKALDYGQSFHYQLLETSYDSMPKEVQFIHDKIMEHPIAGYLFKDTKKEFAMVNDLIIENKLVNAKAMFDIYCEEKQIIADIKTTSATNLNSFISDMTKYNNHIQAVWFSMVANLDPKNFYYIGVNKKFNKNKLNQECIYVYRHTDEEIEKAKFLINNYIKTQWEEVKKYLGQRTQNK
jgi:hypothetical protein